MKKSRKLNTTALEIITDINKVLRNGNIKDTSNELFRFGCDYLLKHNMYHGYNFFKWYVTGFNALNEMFENACDDRYLSEAGLEMKNDPNNYDCLQIYISADLSIGERLESKMN